MAITIDTITVPPQVANTLWILNLTIQAPSPNKPVNAFVTVAPITDSGSLLLDQKATFIISDVLTQAVSGSSLLTAVDAIYTAIQDQVNTLGLYSTGSNP